ncbi:MAG: type IX secretion system sortase PorU, partial [Prolixibacteraceae bacterium]|nr:type IX secretion system sortase PorU [Prolixibacteraceae bacterium]
KVWDITDLFNIREVPLRQDGNTVKGRYRTDVIREFAAFNPDGIFPEPEFTGETENQNLHGLKTPEFLIISHPGFLTQAVELADFHREKDGMTVEVVSADQLYNEFSSGRKDAAAIRNFIKMFYDRKEGLKYVLLFGDGSYDNRNLGKSGSGFIPAFQSENSLNPVQSFVSDDYFVILDDNEDLITGSVDLGIGRLPVSSSYQAEVVINKIKNYYSGNALGKWRNTVCFFADDEDGGMHMSDSEKLTGQLNDNHGEFITKKIYFDAYKQVTGPGGESYPGVTEDINKAVKEGALILNYIGHANERFMADEKVLDVSHINSWSNFNRLPIFVTATCEFSRFDGHETSAGEYILLNPTGGGVGLFSTTRLAYAISNFQLSRSFYNFVFESDENGQPYRLGDIMRLAKINTISSVNKRNFSLLADPALRLSYPDYDVVTTEINGMDAESEVDTVGAMQLVTVSGIITGIDGAKVPDFNGKLIPTVYDKATMVKTLGNAGQTPVEFKVMENIIYNGEAEVINGEFTFSFVIPKDISYNPGQGKIVYYADNGETDANGVFDNFIIGGAGSQITDNLGPDIQLYIDSPEFADGDQVNKNCMLLANIFDDNGINTVGSGIGHDITAILDNDYSNVMVLNDYYRSDPGDYKGGTVRFPLRNLSVGKHTLRVKAWDVANNSSEASIEFLVQDNFSITSVSNYPNPVSEYTYFTFEHNESDSSFDVIIEIFDLNGRRIDYFKNYTGSDGLKSNPVRWNLTRDDLKLRSGIYFYRITAKNSEGKITSESGKMEVIR